MGAACLSKIRALPAVTDVNTDQQSRGLEASLVIDRATASRLGISAAMIDNTLYDAFGQRQVSTMYRQLNQYRVVMTIDPQFWQNPDGLKAIYVRSENGELVPLSAFTHYEPATTARKSITGAVSGRHHLVQSRARCGAWRRRHGDRAGHQRDWLADHHPRQLSGHGTGVPGLGGESTYTACRSLVAVYIVLGILYESFIHDHHPLHVRPASAPCSP